MIDVKEAVFLALDNALANGYDVDKWAVPVIVKCLRLYDADLEDVDEFILKPFVEQWLRERSN